MSPTTRAALKRSGRVRLPHRICHTVEAYRPWFPEGKDTPDLVLLKVDTTWGEYWDSVSGEKTTMDFLKKMVGAEEKKSTTMPEEHAKVTLTAPTQM